MKNVLSLFGLLLCLFSLSTCVDPCEDTTCFNDGFCDEGTCICINGFTGASCQTPPPEDCVVNDTGTFCMENDSASGRTYDIIWDGVRIMVLAPGQRECRTVNAGSHSLRVEFTNTNDTACTPSTPSVPQCGTRSLVCRV